MELGADEKHELRRELLLSFHRQFAENQRNREQSFLKLLAILAGAVAGYGFIYQRTLAESGLEIPYSGILLFHVVATGLLLGGTLVILTISRDFRRDQSVNAEIRRSCELVGPQRIFPAVYDPRVGIRRWGLYDWMPDLLLVFYWMFVASQLVAYLAFLLLTDGRFTLWRADFFLTLGAAFSWVTILASLLIMPNFYRNKLLRVMRLRRASYSAGNVYRRKLRIVRRAWKRRSWFSREAEANDDQRA